MPGTAFASSNELANSTKPNDAKKVIGLIAGSERAKVKTFQEKQEQIERVREERKREQEAKEMQECTFSPAINATPKKGLKNRKSLLEVPQHSSPEDIPHEDETFAPKVSMKSMKLAQRKSQDPVFDRLTRPTSARLSEKKENQPADESAKKDDEQFQLVSDASRKLLSTHGDDGPVIERLFAKQKAHDEMLAAKRAETEELQFKDVTGHPQLSARSKELAVAKQDNHESLISRLGYTPTKGGRKEVEASPSSSNSTVRRKTNIDASMVANLEETVKSLRAVDKARRDEIAALKKEIAQLQFRAESAERALQNQGVPISSTTVIVNN